MSNDKVIFLAFENPDMKRDAITVISCKNCGNKTFILVDSEPRKDFPTLKCAVCGCGGGRIGWVHDE
jgi:hypothetical protein